MRSFYVIAALAVIVSSGSGYAAEITLWRAKVRPVNVALDSMFDEVKTDREFTGFSIYAKAQKALITIRLKESLLDSVFDAATKADNSGQPFFKESCDFLVGEPKINKFYLIIAELSGTRFRIAPMELIAGEWYVQRRSAYISKDRHLIEMFRPYLYNKVQKK